MLLAGTLILADPARKITADFDGASGESVEVYQGNVRTLQLTLTDQGAVLDSTGDSPVFYFFTNSVCTTCTCSWVTATNSAFTVSITSNQLATAGRFTWGAGVSNSSGVTVATRGVITISPDPNR